MLNFFGPSEETNLEEILAQHAAVASRALEDSTAEEKQLRELLQALPAAI